MPNNRDDFLPSVKRTLAERVGWICSFPGCGQSTIGPASQSEDDRINNGVAAHICAASPNGPRYDASMTSEMRKSINNGIWMCRNHGNLIDADFSPYTVETLKQWKANAESEAYKRLSNPAQLSSGAYSDRDLDILHHYCDLFNYEYLQNLKNEPFKAKVRTLIIDPLYNCMAYMEDPNYLFNSAELETLRQELNHKVIAFNKHFGEHSGGSIDYYDYIDLNLIRLRHPDLVDHYESYIEHTQQLAYEVYEVALKLLTKKAQSGN